MTEEEIDKKSLEKAVALFETGKINNIEVGTVKGLYDIHLALFGGLYNFAGKTRTDNISKGVTRFCQIQFLDSNLKIIEKMPQSTFDEIVEKYVEMNMAHPFREGNGRATRIWLDQIFKQALGQVVDWASVDKREYLMAMERSPLKDLEIKDVLKRALTTDYNNRQVIFKGLACSYVIEGMDEYYANDYVEKYY
ncbi:MAG: Fic family protein [Gammaproteobacteria bacterium]|nr:Fic family protein [Gammaproteobacteria bacterium]